MTVYQGSVLPVLTFLKAEAAASPSTVLSILPRPKKEPEGAKAQALLLQEDHLLEQHHVYQERFCEWRQTHTPRLQIQRGKKKKKKLHADSN